MSKNNRYPASRFIGHIHRRPCCCILYLANKGMIQRKVTTCPYCDSREIIKKRVRANHTRTLQIYCCKNCWKYFTPLSAVRTKYTPEIISRTLLLYYQGHSQEEVSRRLKGKQRFIVPRRTIGRWITKYKAICTFHGLRETVLAQFPPAQLIAEHQLEHRQVYIFKKHVGKLAALSKSHDAAATHIASYLEEIMKPTYPHHLFRSDKDQDVPNTSTQTNRSSQLVFNTLPFVTKTKHNSANDLATFGLFLAKRTIERHPMIEEFMLWCDGKTIAIEVPVYLQAEDIHYFQKKGFYLPLTAKEAPITGHIDVLQIRNGVIHILDYKPDARKINPVNQLLLYALALASRTRLPLKTFACAWFDEKDYFSFYPLHAVYRKRNV
jgi:ATP-dependent exoDNAse (exonuclease V) beta subunit